MSTPVRLLRWAGVLVVLVGFVVASFGARAGAASSCYGWCSASGLSVSGNTLEEVWGRDFTNSTGSPMYVTAVRAYISSGAGSQSLNAKVWSGSTQVASASATVSSSPGDSTFDVPLSYTIAAGATVRVSVHWPAGGASRYRYVGAIGTTSGNLNGGTAYYTENAGNVRPTTSSGIASPVDVLADTSDPAATTTTTAAATTTTTVPATTTTTVAATTTTTAVTTTTTAAATTTTTAVPSGDVVLAVEQLRRAVELGLGLCLFFLSAYVVRSWGR